MKRLVWYTVIVLVTLGLLALLWQFRPALILFMLSLVVAAAFRPVIERLDGRGLPHILSILLAYFFVLCTILLPIFLASAPFVDELQKMTDRFAAAYTAFQLDATKGSQLEQTIAAQLPPIDALYKGIAGDRGSALAQNVFGLASGVLDLISRLVIVLILSIYWSADRFHFERLWLSMLPAGSRSRARKIWRDIETGVGSYVRSEVVQSLLAAILLFISYKLLGLEYPTILAIVGAIFWLIPWLGAFLAVIPAFLIGLGSSLPVAILAAAITLLILGIMEILVEPRFFNRRRYSSLLVVLMLVAMSDAFGLVGLLFAPPLAAAIQILFSNLLSQPASEVPADPDTKFTSLRTQLVRLNEIVDRVKEDAPHIGSLMDRLNGLIDRTEVEVRAKTLQ